MLNDIEKKREINWKRNLQNIFSKEINWIDFFFPWKQVKRKIMFY